MKVIFLKRRISGSLNETFSSAILRDMYNTHGRIAQISDGSPESGEHIDLANISDDIIGGCEEFTGDYTGYEHPVVISFEDGFQIIFEGAPVTESSSAWQMKTAKRENHNALFKD